jgi:hypothetical protein
MVYNTSLLTKGRRDAKEIISKREAERRKRQL